MKNIEVEVRSFITKEQYDQILTFFMKNAKLVSEDYQETHYLKTKQDLRIQKNDSYSKIWLKSGKIHDEMREEVEVQFNRSDFPKIQKIFNDIEISTEIKWFRRRKQFLWKNITVALDYTKGYGYIIELEKMCSEEEKHKTLEEIKMEIKKLRINITPKEEFDEKYKHYKENWKELTK